MKVTKQKGKRERTELKAITGNKKFEDAIRSQYEPKYGWINKDTQLLFVAQEKGKAVNVSDGAWAIRDCCRDFTDECTFNLCKDKHIHPQEVSWECLERFHDKDHLNVLRTNKKELLDVFEIDVPDEDECDLIETILDPARRDVGGCIVGAALAYVYGICVVTGGGTHHASCSVAEGSCLFVDVPLSWVLLRDTLISLNVAANPKALYIDVDVHHANGFAHARDELGITDHFMMIDLFNRDIYPFWNEYGEKCDDSSLEFIDIAKPFPSGTGNKKYLALLKDALNEAEDKLPRPDIVFYMGSVDPLKGDPLGKADITPNGIYERDRMVIQWAQERNIPLVYYVGGGYGENACAVTRSTLVRLNEEFCIWDGHSLLFQNKK